MVNASEKIEQELGLPRGFIDSLFSEHDDWSFVIKAQALVETAFNQALGEHIRNPQVLERIVRLSFPERRKIHRAYVGSILESGEDRALEALTGLRNHLAHNVRHTGFSFDEFFGDQTAKQKFLSAMTAPPWAAAMKRDQSPLAEVATSTPRVATWLSVYLIAARIVADLHAHRDAGRRYQDALIAALDADSGSKANE